MRITILPPPEAAKANRVIPQFMQEGTSRQMYDWFWDNLQVLKDKSAGAFVIPVDFITEDYMPAVVKWVDDQGWPRERVLRDANGNTYIRRCAENVNQLWMMPVDVDDGLTLAEAKERWSDYRYIAYSSYNHLVDGKTEKFRFLIEYSKPIGNADFALRRKSMQKWLGDGVDMTTLYRSRGFYIPAINPATKDHFFLDFNEGTKLLNPFDFNAEEPPKFEPSKYKNEEMNDDDRQEILDKLQQTTIDSYHVWWQMVQAMKSEGYSASDVMYVSAGNGMHSSKTTGVKDVQLCKEIYTGCRPQRNGMGKLITLIRRDDPNFRKSRKSIQADLLSRFKGDSK